MSFCLPDCQIVVHFIIGLKTNSQWHGPHWHVVDCQSMMQIPGSTAVPEGALLAPDLVAAEAGGVR